MFYRFDENTDLCNPIGAQQISLYALKQDVGKAAQSVDEVLFQFIYLYFIRIVSKKSARKILEERRKQQQTSDTLHKHVNEVLTNTVKSRKHSLLSLRIYFRQSSL